MSTGMFVYGSHRFPWHKCRTSGKAAAHSALRRAVISAPSSRAKSFSPSTPFFGSLLLRFLCLPSPSSSTPCVPIFLQPARTNLPKTVATNCLTSRYSCSLPFYIDRSGLRPSWDFFACASRLPSLRESGKSNRN